MEKLIISTVSNEECLVNDIFKGAIASTSKSRAVGEVGVMSIVKARTGNRKILSKELLRKLNNPEKVQIGFTQDSVIIGEKLPDNDSLFNIKINGAKGIIYSSQLVIEIADLFNLDFSGRTSITFNEVEYVLKEGYPVAIVKIK